MNKIHHRHKYSNVDLHNDLEKIKNAINEAAYDIKDETSDLISQSIQDVKAKSAEVRDNVADYVSDKPLQTVGIAVCVGVLLGYLLKK